MTLTILSGGICREVEVIDLTQSQSSDESVSLAFDDEYYSDYDDSTHGFDERYARTIALVYSTPQNEYHPSFSSISYCKF